MDEKVTSSASQAPNVAGGETAQQAPIASTGAAGNVAGNDAVGLPMDLGAIDAALGFAPSAPVEAPVPAAASSGNDQATQSPTGAPAAGQTAPEATQAAAVSAPAPASGPNQAQPEAQGPGAGERIVPARISTGQFSEQTQRAMALMHQFNNGKPEGSEGTVSLADCLGMVQAADGGQPIQATPVSTSQPEPIYTQPSELDVLRGEVEELEATIQQAGEDQSLFGPELARATIELADKKAALRTHEALEAQARQATIQNHVTQRSEIKAQVVAEYKGAEDTSSVLGSRVATLVKEWQNPAHPRHKDLELVEAPRLVVEEAAKQTATSMSQQFGIPYEAAMNALRTAPTTPTASSTPQAAHAVNQLPPAAGNIQAAAAPGTASAAPAPAPLTEAQLLAKAASDPSLIDSLLGYSSGLMIR